MFKNFVDCPFVTKSYILHVIWSTNKTTFKLFGDIK